MCVVWGGGGWLNGAIASGGGKRRIVVNLDFQAGEPGQYRRRGDEAVEIESLVKHEGL